MTPSFKNYVLEQVGASLRVTTRPMFGGVTLFVDGRAFALLADDRIYLKVDDLTRPLFEALGTGPFLPFGEADRPMRSYHELPGELLEDVDLLAPWLERACQAAARAPRKKGKG